MLDNLGGIPHKGYLHARSFVNDSVAVSKQPHQHIWAMWNFALSQFWKQLDETC